MVNTIIKCKKCRKTIAHFVLSPIITRPLWFNIKKTFDIIETEFVSDPCNNPNDPNPGL